MSIRFCPLGLTNFVRILVLAGLLSGCTTSPTRPGILGPIGAEPQEHDQTARWQQICIRLEFDEQGEADFTSDLILAHRVFKPILQEYRNEISLWRFHRRAADDSTGHQFSFFFYSHNKLEDVIQEQVSSNRFYRTLRNTDKISELRRDCRNPEFPEQISALSDGSWDPDIQNSWPYFAMGASAAWLQLVDEISHSLDGEHSEMYHHYEAVEQELLQLWQNQGQHAYLHHLNALFGYQPLIIKNWMRF